MAYVIWPFALFELARRSTGSLWYRTHLRQGAALGIVLTAALLAVLAIPLFVVLLFGDMNSSITIVVYGIAMVFDAIVFGWAAIVVIRAMLRAGRGEIFEIPVIGALGEKLFRPKRDPSR